MKTGRWLESRVAALILSLVALSARADAAAPIRADTAKVASAKAVRVAFDARGARHAVEVWAGVSGRSSQFGQLGDMPDERLALAALRFTWQIHQHDGVSVEYGVDLIPMAMTSPPYAENRVSCDAGAGCSTLGANAPHGIAAHGTGINPVSLTAIFRTDRALQFRVDAAAGALWFDRPVPTTKSAQFNFTGMVGFGMQLLGSHGNGLVLMYRFHHLSNARLGGGENPGMASHLMSLGGRWRLGPSLR